LKCEVYKKEKVENTTKKYKQTHIPKVSTEGIDYRDRAKFIKDFYAKNLYGKSVVNKDLGITIHFNSIGRNELAYGRALYVKKVAILKCLLELLEVAEYNNFGRKKDTDKETVLGYLNFKAKVIIDDKMENVRINILLKKNGKAYYNHEVNIKNKTS
jgi:hypothetical protein